MGFPLQFASVSLQLAQATVLRTVALHRHGCGADALLLQICGTPRFCGPWYYTATGVCDDHDNGNDNDDDDHDDHDHARRHDKLDGSIDVSATGLHSATMRESLHQPISSN